MELIDKIQVGGATAVCFLLVLATAIASTYGLENVNVVQVYDVDEYRFLTLMAQHLQEGSLDPHGFYFYGHLYDSVGYYLIRGLTYFGWSADTQLMGVVLRFVSLIFGVVAALALFQLSRLMGLPIGIAALASLLLLAMPDFALYMRTVHPDTMQTAFVIIAVTIALRCFDFTHAFWATAFAALAFGTKYSGLLILPVCFAPFTIAALICKRPVFRTCLVLAFQWGVLVTLFAAIFALTNPYAARNLQAVYDTLSYMSHYVATGHGKIEPHNPALWMPPMNDQFGWGGLAFLLAGYALAAVGLASTVANDARATLHDRHQIAKAILMAFVLGAAVHLLANVRIREPRYAYHFIPFLIVLGVGGWWIAVKDCLSVLPRWATKTAVALAIAIIAAWQSNQSLMAMADASNKPHDPIMTAGAFLSDNFKPSTRILADMYTYLPPKFTAFEYAAGVDHDSIDHFRPDVFVINKKVTGRIVWKAAGTKLADRKYVIDTSFGDRADHTVNFLNSILSQGTKWTVIYESDVAVVLAPKSEF